MADIEKVIKGLECCSVPEGHCEKCPYETDGYVAECTSALARDALALLKEQETELSFRNEPSNPIVSFTRSDGTKAYSCPRCAAMLHGGEYCSHCGQKLDWEGR